MAGAAGDAGHAGAAEAPGAGGSADESGTVDAAGAPGTSVGDERWERSSEVLWRRLSDGVAVLPRDGKSVFTLAGLHAEVWGALNRPATVAGLVDQLGDRLGPDEEAGQRTTAEVVRFLVAAGVVRESPERSTRESPAR